eukprot:UN16790
MAGVTPTMEPAAAIQAEMYVPRTNLRARNGNREILRRQLFCAASSSALLKRYC